MHRDRFYAAGNEAHRLRQWHRQLVYCEIPAPPEPALHQPLQICRNLPLHFPE